MRWLLIMCVVLASTLTAVPQVQRFEAPRVTIRKLTLQGSRLAPALQQDIVRDVKRHTYRSSEISEIAERIRFELQKRGYAIPIVDEPEVTVVWRSGTQDILNATVAVEEGAQYRFGDIRFGHSSVFAPTALRQLFPIRTGDVFDITKIRLGLDALRRVYARAAYINFTAIPVPELDNVAHLISWHIELDEGHMFRCGPLVVAGTESEAGARSRLLQAWKAYQGKPFRGPSTLKRFLRDIHARPDVRPEDIFDISLDQWEHTVTVKITLATRG